MAAVDSRGDIPLIVLAAEKLVMPSELSPDIRAALMSDRLLAEYSSLSTGAPCK